MGALFSDGPRSVWLVEEAVSRRDVVPILNLQIDSITRLSRKYEHYLLQLRIEFLSGMVDWMLS